VKKKGKKGKDPRAGGMMSEDMMPKPMKKKMKKMMGGTKPKKGKY